MTPNGVFKKAVAIGVGDFIFADGSRQHVGTIAKQKPYSRR